MTIENESLLKEAEELKIDVKKFDEEEVLQDAVDEKKDEIEEQKKKENDVEYWKAEAKKSFEERDRFKKDYRTVNKKLGELTDKLNEAPNKSEFDKIQNELKELKKLKDDLDELAAAKELEDKTELEKQEIRFKKEIDRFEINFKAQLEEVSKKVGQRDEQLGEREKEIKRLRRYQLDSEIMKVANKHKAYNPSQIVKLVSSDFTYDETLEKFTFHVLDEKGKLIDEKSVEERIKEFLEDPDNDNLVESEVNTTGTGEKKSDKFVSGKKRGGYDPKDPKLVEQADFKGLSVDDHIDILIKRDEKLKKIKEKS